MIKLKPYPYITYEDLQKRDPIDYFSRKTGLPKDYIQEIYRICETDWRFTSSRARYTEYKKISEYIGKMWRIELNSRQIRYMHEVLRNHFKLMEMLKRGGKMFGTYRDLVLRGGYRRK